MKKFYSVLFAFLILLAGTSFFPQKVNAQECGAPVPPTPSHVKAVSGAAAGQVTLYWDEAAYANRYAVAYGTKSGKYMYGADNIGGSSSRSFTVKSLTPGVKYYFVLAAARNCSSSGFSKEFSAVAGGGAVVTAPAVGAPQVVQPTTKAMVTPSVWTRSGGPVGAQKLMARPGPKVGEVTLTWQHADSANNYHLVYGTSAGKYQYGALNLGNVTKFTVRSLQAGRTYYFALVPLMGERPLYTTSPVSASAFMPVEVIVTSRENLIEPPPPPPVVSATPSEQVINPQTENTLPGEEQITPQAVQGVSDEVVPEEKSDPAEIQGMSDDIPLQDYQ